MLSVLACKFFTRSHLERQSSPLVLSVSTRARSALFMFFRACWFSCTRSGSAGEYTLCSILSRAACGGRWRNFSRLSLTSLCNAGRTGICTTAATATSLVAVPISRTLLQNVVVGMSLPTVPLHRDQFERPECSSAWRCRRLFDKGRRKRRSEMHVQPHIHLRSRLKEEEAGFGAGRDRPEGVVLVCAGVGVRRQSPRDAAHTAVGAPLCAEHEPDAVPSCPRVQLCRRSNLPCLPCFDGGVARKQGLAGSGFSGSSPHDDWSKVGWPGARRSEDLDSADESIARSTRLGRAGCGSGYIRFLGGLITVVLASSSSSSFCSSVGQSSQPDVRVRGVFGLCPRCSGGPRVGLRCAESEDEDDEASSEDVASWLLQCERSQCSSEMEAAIATETEVF